LKPIEPNQQQALVDRLMTACGGAYSPQTRRKYFISGPQWAAAYQGQALFHAPTREAIGFERVIEEYAKIGIGYWTTHDTDVILATHTGIKWRRTLSGDRHFINVGVLGRPENDGRTNVWYTLLSAEPELRVEFIPLAYDHERLAAEMRAEQLPEEFVATILTGWWTTCLEILPAKERRRGKN